jgi:hypothetical protein
MMTVRELDFPLAQQGGELVGLLAVRAHQQPLVKDIVDLQSGRLCKAMLVMHEEGKCIREQRLCI